MSENNEIKEPLNKNNKVPRLRFKNFEEDWIVVNFYSHFTYFSTNSLSWDELNYKSGDYLNLHYGIIHSNNSNLILSSSLPFINQDKMPKRFTLINEGDLILVDTSEDRKDAAKGIEIINKSNANILSGLHTIHLREKILCTIPGFKTYYVASKSFRNFARKYCEGIKVFSIKPSLLKYTHFAYPQNKSEQFMIVNFFNKIEAKKAILEKKIDILKKYKEGIKKYVMKDTIKFWKTGIGNAIELKNFLFEKNEYCVKNGLYPHITLSTEGITDKSERYDRDFLVKNENKKYKITHLNQLCYNPANLKFGVICINKYGNGIFSPIYSTFDINSIIIDYLELIITSNDFINYSMKYQQGTVFERMSVSSDDLCKIKIVTICFDEQKKIAKVADTLNKKNSKLEDELLSLKHLKSTLLNDMFI